MSFVHASSLKNGMDCMRPFDSICRTGVPELQLQATIPSNDVIRKFISHLLNRLEDNTTSVTATVTAAAENAMDTVLEKQKL